MLSTLSVGPQPGLSQQQFLPYMAPVHLPSLASQDGSASERLPTGHTAAALEVSGINDTLPLRTGFDFGSQEEFAYLSNTNEILTKCKLVVRLAALQNSDSTTGVRTKNPRYVDDILCAAIDKAEWLYGSTNSAFTIQGDELHFSRMQETADEALDKHLYEQAAGLSKEERVALSANAQEVRLDLPWWWTDKRVGGWHAYALGRPLKIRITWRSPEYLLQQDTTDARPLPYGATTYITDKWLHFETAIPTEATKMVYRQMVESKGDQGLIDLIKDFQTQEFTLTTGTYHQLKTDMFTKYGHNMRFILRPSANLTPSYLNNERFKTLSIADAQFDLANKVFFPKTADIDLKHVINDKAFDGNRELAIYNIPLCPHPEFYRQAFGGIEFSQVSMPMLKLTTATVTSNITVTVFCYVHNYVRLVIKGTSSAIETILPLN